MFVLLFILTQAHSDIELNTLVQVVIVVFQVIFAVSIKIDVSGETRDYRLRAIKSSACHRVNSALINILRAIDSSDERKVYVIAKDEGDKLNSILIDLYDDKYEFKRLKSNIKDINKCLENYINNGIDKIELERILVEKNDELEKYC